MIKYSRTSDCTLEMFHLCDAYGFKGISTITLIVALSCNTRTGLGTVPLIMTIMAASSDSVKVLYGFTGQSVSASVSLIMYCLTIDVPNVSLDYL